MISLRTNVVCFGAVCHPNEEGGDLSDGFETHRDGKAAEKPREKCHLALLRIFGRIEDRTV
jgi:hypothetical protein